MNSSAEMRPCRPFLGVVYAKRATAMLPLLLFVCFLVGAGLGLYVLASVRMALVHDWGPELARRAAELTDALDRFLAERMGDVQLIAAHPALRSGKPAEAEVVLRRYRETYGHYDWLAVADGSGQIRIATEPSQVGRTLGQEPWFLAARQSGARSQVVEILSSSESGLTAVVFSAPLQGRRGEVQGVVAGQVSLEALREFIEQVGRFDEGPGEAYDWLLLNREGFLLSERYPVSEQAGNLRERGLPSALRAMNEPNGIPRFVEEVHARRHVPVLTGYARSHGAGPFSSLDWTVLVRLDRAKVYQPIDRLIWKVGGTGLLIVFPLTAFGIWSVRRLIQEGRLLQDSSQAWQTLIATVRGMTAQSDQAQMLTDLTEAARRLTGARYAALALLSAEDPRLPSFIISGMDEAGQRAIGKLPQGLGVLGALPDDGTVLRLKDLQRHPAAVGFPPHHPPMRSFLGVAIRTHGQTCGRLYLTDKQGAEEFTEMDAHLVAALAAQAGIVIENVRLLQSLRAAEAQHRAAKTQLANVLECAPDIIIFTDQKGQITLFNRGAEQTLGYQAAEMIGTPVADLYVDPRERQAVLHEFQAAGHVVGREIHLRTKSGESVILSLTLSPYLDPEGQYLGTVGISKDITAAKRLEEALRASNAELESFVYVVSHDLQTPLRGIHGFAELLLNHPRELDERQRHYLARIQAGSVRMARLIDGLLEYSRLDRIRHPFTVVSMEQVLQQARTECALVMQKSRAELRYEGTLPVVWGDGLRLGQVWQNLLTNAVKYVKRGDVPHITVGGREGPSASTFWIRDQGIGIPARFHDHIFQLFRRLHLEEHYEGTGVGLAIVKRIVEFHKGKIWVESTEGRGSTFFFTIPRPPAGGTPPDNGSSQSPLPIC
ncbi:MAG: PAS domain S-box protein [Gaiellales bacterium]|nr:MAG: PAS domain S-box protein [Gaiellales bacterium]